MVKRSLFRLTMDWLGAVAPNMVKLALDHATRQAGD